MKNWKLCAKKILVFTLAIAMTVNAVDIPVLAAAIGATRSDEVQSETQIAESEPLEEDIQTPDALRATTEQETTEQETTDVPDVQNVKNSNDSNEGTYTTLSEEETELTGKLELSIPDGSSLKEGVTITATFTDDNYNEGENKYYTYTWYCVDGNTETAYASSPETLSKESIHMIRQEEIGKSLYCKVTKEGITGEVKSETIGPVLGISIEGATITLANTNLKYDGTEKKPTITVTLSDGVTTISQNVGYTATYENNIHAGTAKVIITGIQPYYYGTVEKTFTIGQKTDYEDGLEIEGVADTYEYTGEEMVCIINSDPERAVEIAERLRQAIEETTHSIVQDGKNVELNVTVSMGIHTMDPSEEMTPENARRIFDEEFKNADNAVYEAKETGRNKIVCADEKNGTY